MSLAPVEMTTMASKHTTWEGAGTPVPEAISRLWHQKAGEGWAHKECSQNKRLLGGSQNGQEGFQDRRSTEAGLRPLLKYLIRKRCSRFLGIPVDESRAHRRTRHWSKHWVCLKILTALPISIGRQKAECACPPPSSYCLASLPLDSSFAYTSAWEKNFQQLPHTGKE